MNKRKALSKAGLIVVVAVSLFVCPLATGGDLGSSQIPAKAQAAQFTFVPQLTPLDIEATPETTTIPTLGPAQYFEEGQEGQLPDVSRPDLLGEEDLGYSAILGQPGKYLVWSIDDEGNRHYYVLDETSDYFIRIRGIVDANWEARRILDESNPYLGLMWAGIKTIFGEIVTLGCGIGTAATLLEAPPIGAVFGTCTAGAATFFGLSIDEFIDINNSIRAYNLRTEDDRNAIEGIFREIEAAPSP